MDPARLRKLIGIPFINGGRDYAGADCWGLVMLAYKELFGIVLPDYTISCFATEDIDHQVSRDRGKWTHIEEPEAPSAVVMRIDYRMPMMCNHIGVYVGEGRMLHTLKKQNSVLQRIDHPYFSRRIEGYYAFAA